MERRRDWRFTRGWDRQPARFLPGNPKFLEVAMRRLSELLLIGVALFFATPLLAQISVPEIPFDSVPNLLKYPDNIVMGEAVGVATNSKGHIFVYTRSGLLSYTVGTSRQFGHGAAARLYEFDQNGN